MLDIRDIKDVTSVGTDNGIDSIHLPSGVRKKEKTLKESSVAVFSYHTCYIDNFLLRQINFPKNK